MRWELSKEAKNDIDNIYVYTATTFGLSKANSYAERLKERLTFLSEMPNIGQKMNISGNAMFRFLYESHSIYYRIEHNSIIILRILHQRMDPGGRII